MTARRKEPYTEIGIKRVKCFKCRIRQATQQWQICADGNTFRAVCLRCDVELNRLVMLWAFGNSAKTRRAIEAYIKKLELVYGPRDEWP